MHGNVAEWCDGWQIPKEFVDQYKDDPVISYDPNLIVAPIRGGFSRYGANACRSAAVETKFGCMYFGVVGVRVARDLDD